MLFDLIAVMAMHGHCVLSLGRNKGQRLAYRRAVSECRCKRLMEMHMIQARKA